MTYWMMLFQWTFGPAMDGRPSKQETSLLLSYSESLASRYPKPDWQTTLKPFAWTQL